MEVSAHCILFPLCPAPLRHLQDRFPSPRIVSTRCAVLASFTYAVRQLSLLSQPYLRGVAVLSVPGRVCVPTYACHSCSTTRRALIAPSSSRSIVFTATSPCTVPALAAGVVYLSPRHFPYPIES